MEFAPRLPAISAGGHQQQFENRQDNLRDLLNQTAAQAILDMILTHGIGLLVRYRRRPQGNNMSVQDTELASIWINLHYLLARKEREKFSLFRD
jgi:hypothetical protein